MAKVFTMPVAGDPSDDAHAAARQAGDAPLVRKLAHLHAVVAIAMYRAGFDATYQRVSADDVEQMQPEDIADSILKAMRGQ